MTVWCQALILLCSTLICVDSAPSPVLQSSKYKNSFHLTRSTRTRVQQLLKTYDEQMFKNNEGPHLEGLPLLSTDYYSWLKMKDWDRLNAAFRDLQIYWNMLEWKRKQLEKEEREQMAVHSHLPQRIKHIQLDLRDLMNQISSQMRYIRRSCTQPTSPSAWTPLDPETKSNSAWDRRVEGYIILRDLDLYLTKLARDFLLLASKAHR